MVYMGFRVKTIKGVKNKTQKKNGFDSGLYPAPSAKKKWLALIHLA